MDGLGGLARVAGVPDLNGPNDCARLDSRMVFMVLLVWMVSVLMVSLGLLVSMNSMIVLVLMA